MRIFITGAGGLLGSKLAEVAAADGHDVFSGYNRSRPEVGVPVKFDLSEEGRDSEIGWSFYNPSIACDLM